MPVKRSASGQAVYPKNGTVFETERTCLSQVRSVEEDGRCPLRIRVFLRWSTAAPAVGVRHGASHWGRQSRCHESRHPRFQGNGRRYLASPGSGASMTNGWPWDKLLEMTELERGERDRKRRDFGHTCGPQSPIDLYLEVPPLPTAWFAPLRCLKGRGGSRDPRGPRSRNMKTTPVRSPGWLFKIIPT